MLCHLFGMNKNMQKINPADLTELRPEGNILVKVAYADPHFANNYFGQVYHPAARMWAQKRLADILHDAADLAFRRFGWKFLLLDALRPTEAQAKMYSICERDFSVAAAKLNKVVSDLVAPAGKGAHPRGLAVDLAPITERGELIDMGGHFDQFWKPFSLRSQTFDSPFSSDAEILQRRADLESIMQETGGKHGLPLSCKISDEWWDFRPVPDYYNGFVPLSNAELPDKMRMLPEDKLSPRDYADPIMLDPVARGTDGKISYAPLSSRHAFHQPSAEVLGKTG